MTRGSVPKEKDSKRSISLDIKAVPAGDVEKDAHSPWLSSLQGAFSLGRMAGRMEGEQEKANRSKRTSSDSWSEEGGDPAEPNTRLSRWVAGLPAVVNMKDATPRSIFAGSKRTSIRLEPAFWDALDEMIEREGLSRTYFVTLIDGLKDSNVNLASAIRIAILRYYQEKP